MPRLANSLEENRILVVHERIMANLQVQVGWVDVESGNKTFVDGTTENVGENSTLINLHILPPVGSQVTLRIIEKEKTIIEVQAQVIRVVRDPSKPLAALLVLDKIEKWRHIALTAAQNWVTKHFKLNYDFSEEYVN